VAFRDFPPEETQCGELDPPWRAGAKIDRHFEAKLGIAPRLSIFPRLPNKTFAREGRAIAAHSHTFLCRRLTHAPIFLWLPPLPVATDVSFFPIIAVTDHRRSAPQTAASSQHATARTSSNGTDVLAKYGSCRTLGDRPRNPDILSAW
jgi:hypothetical protein